MNQNLEMKKFMSEKLAEGLSLSDIQKLIAEKFGRKLTYMDIRVMASELDNVDWDAHDPKAQEKAKAAAKKAEEDKNPDEPVDPAVDSVPADGPGKTVVELSKVVRPGTMAGGTVKFGSGVTAEWFVDQTGRLGLDKVKGGEPNETDVRDFQQELQKLFER